MPPGDPALVSVDDLHRDYRGSCTCLCICIPRGTGDRTVERSAAKSTEPEGAYGWSNVVAAEFYAICDVRGDTQRSNLVVRPDVLYGWPDEPPPDGQPLGKGRTV